MRRERFKPNDHEDTFITPENESKLWERRLRRDVGVAPTKYVADFQGKHKEPLKPLGICRMWQEKVCR